MLNLAGQFAAAPVSDPRLDGRRNSTGAAPLTLQDLVEAVAEFARTDAELIATVQHMISSGSVRFQSENEHLNGLLQG